MIARALKPGLLSLLLLAACDQEEDKSAFGNHGTPAPAPELETGDDDTSSGSDSGGESGGETGDPNGSDSGGGDSGGGEGGGDSGGGEGGGDSGGGEGGGDSGGTSTDGSFDEEGDVVSYEDSDAVAEISLADESGESNINQEFYMVLVNTEDSAMSWQLRYTDQGGASSGAGRPGKPEARRERRETPFRAALREARALGRLDTASPPEAPPPALGVDDIGATEREFRVRNDLEDDETYDLVDATLWAVGDSVAIWVDNDVPIDWDYECDGIVDQEDHYDAYGFDNCDLQTIADIVDTNIFPNVSSLYGEASDVNEDGLVSVVITPVLNVLPLTSDDEDGYGGVVESYADPEVDLSEWDADSNPGSNEQEVIYVFAPDPYGYYNSLASTTIDEYTAVSLTAQIARAYAGLVSYNQHVLEYEGDAEESWLDAALGSLAADLTGFGAVYHDDAWKYLDAPHLYGLTDTEEEGSISSETVGAQYLFARWLVDAYGTDILASMIQTSSTGTDAVEEATGADFTDLVVAWQVALLTTGVKNGDGDRLVSDDSYPPYNSSSIISAPTSDPLPGDYYGANGYQTGININGENIYVEGGTTDSPTENEGNLVTLENTDHFIHVTGLEFYGYVEGNYAAQVVRLTDPPYASTGLEIQGSDEGFSGAVVRWNKLGADVAVEDIFSATDANDLALPTLPVGSGTIVAVGNLSDPGLTVVVSSDGEEEPYDVPDTDRWLLDLSERSGEEIHLAIALTRRFNADGDASPEDPWLAVVPADYVPTPTVDGTTSGTCEDGASFAYPSSILDYLYYQVFLSSEAYSDSEDDFDACGTASESATTCDVDWDLDGVLDEDEPAPETFLEQVWVMQCTLAGGDSSGYTALDTDVIDEDSTDDDDAATYDMTRNLGGTTDGDAEDAYLEITLEGGQEYILVVGASEAGTGTYELSITTLEDEG